MQWAKKQTQFGFTIVELLIVVVVIAILAAITVVAYGAVRQRATESLMMNTAEYVAKEMQNRRTLDGTDSFAQTLPAGLDLPEKIGVATTDTGDPQTFCINVTHADFNDVYFSIKNDDTPKKELCAGAVVASSTEYNAAAGTDGSPVLARKVCGTMYNFCIERNDNYSALDLTWDSQGSDVTYYNVHSRLPDDTWYVHQVSGGATGWSSGTTSNGYTNRIPSSTTSMNWTNSGTIPQPGTAREFRFRYYSSSTSTYSDWTYVTFTREALPEVPSFTVAPSSDWSNINITWNSPGEQSAYNGFYYNVHSRLPEEADWYVHQISGGSGGYSSGTSNTGYTNRIPKDSTSMNWTNAGAIPQPGTSREFRIRAYTLNSGGSGGDSKAGPWTTFTLTRSALPAVTGFTVTPNASWSNITLTWDDAAGVSDDRGFYYNVHSRLPDDTWYVHTIGSGSGNYSSGTISSGYTNRILNDTTSLLWTSSSVIPSSGASREFRIRAYTTVSSGSGGENQAGPWSTFTLTRP